MPIPCLPPWKPGETEAQVDEAVALIAILSARSTGAADLMEDALVVETYFQSLRTEDQKFLDARRSDLATRRYIAELIRERILKRHLWVASPKFRKQKAYTFHIEPEDNFSVSKPVSVLPQQPTVGSSASVPA